MITQGAGLSGAERARLLDSAFREPSEAGARFEPRSQVEREVGGLAREAARDGFSAGFKVAALAVLLAVPFAWLMRRRPGDHAPLKKEAAEPAVASS